jgi:hypothetical protein
MAAVSEAELRAELKAAMGDLTLREVAAQIGCSHYSVWKVVKGGTVRPSTAARIRAWLDNPADAKVAVELRTALKRAVGRFGLQEVRRVEEEVGDALRRAYTRAGESPPAWVGKLGKKQV